MKNFVRHIFQIVLVVILLAAGGVTLKYLTDTKAPLAQKRPHIVVPMARVMTAQAGPVSITVHGEGTVAPLRQTTVSAEVSGKVVYVSPKLVNGGHFSKGEVMLRTDPRDYTLNVSMKRARVLEAQTYLQSTEVESAAAWDEWKRVAGNPKKQPPPLLIKVPQLAEAKAKLAAAKSELAKAELDLQRTELLAPFDSRVVNKYVDLGQYLKLGDKFAEVFDTQAAEIVVHLEDQDIAWLIVPGLTDSGIQGSSAEVVSRFAGKDHSWPGRVVRSQGTVDQRTRLVPVVVRVEEPYSRNPPLTAGIHVSIKLEGSRLKEAFSLPRRALRPGSEVWVVENDKIVFRPVQVARLQGEQVFITEGLMNGDQVVISPLKAVTLGMKVRVVQSGDIGNKS